MGGDGPLLTARNLESAGIGDIVIEEGCSFALKPAAALDGRLPGRSSGGAAYLRLRHPMGGIELGIRRMNDTVIIDTIERRYLIFWDIDERCTNLEIGA